VDTHVKYFRALVPVEHLLDMLHTHLPYDGLTTELTTTEKCRELQGRRELRREWLHIASALVGADRGGVHEEDLVVVEQMCVEWSDALQVTELLELLTVLLYSHPASVYPGRTRCPLNCALQLFGF
jgi:hypothetical protein